MPIFTGKNRIVLAGSPLLSDILKRRRTKADALNGAAARKVQVGDVVIIASYALMDFEQAKTFRPWIVFPDTETNRIVG